MFCAYQPAANGRAAPDDPQKVELWGWPTNPQANSAISIGIEHILLVKLL